MDRWNDVFLRADDQSKLKLPEKKNGDKIRDK